MEFIQHVPERLVPPPQPCARMREPFSLVEVGDKTP